MIHKAFRKLFHPVTSMKRGVSNEKEFDMNANDSLERTVLIIN